MQHLLELTSSYLDMRAQTLELGGESEPASATHYALIVSSFALCQMGGSAKLQFF